MSFRVLPMTCCCGRHHAARARVDQDNARAASVGWPRDSPTRTPPMLQRTLTFALAFAAVHATAPRASAQENNQGQGYPLEPLLSTGTTIPGETIHYPRTGPAHVNAAIIKLAPG